MVGEGERETQRETEGGFASAYMSESIEEDQRYLCVTISWQFSLFAHQDPLTELDPLAHFQSLF